MLDIKIFVSHRIDINSELIDNPLYIPMRCGAVFDEENPMNIPGDDTGDNISEKRMSYCEFTVQYWAWKNVQADYYGLCHYRRFFSFNEKALHAHRDDMMIHEPVICDSVIKKHSLASHEKMYDTIIRCDAIVSKYIDIKFVPTPDGIKKTTGDMWDSYVGVPVCGKKCSDFVIGLIKDISPLYLESAITYFNGNKHRGFNCYIMKRNLFDEMCAFQFPIMNRASEILQEQQLTENDKFIRLPAYIGEILNGIYLYHLELKKIYNIKERNLVFFSDTKHYNSVVLSTKRVVYYLKSFFNKLINLVLPKGSKRRTKVKKLFYRGGNYE